MVDSWSFWLDDFQRRFWAPFGPDGGSSAMVISSRDRTQMVIHFSASETASGMYHRPVNSPNDRGLVELISDSLIFTALTLSFSVPMRGKCTFRLSKDVTLNLDAIPFNASLAPSTRASGSIIPIYLAEGIPLLFSSGCSHL